MELILSLVAGAAGGNLADGLTRPGGLGSLVGSLAGVLGGALGVWILAASWAGGDGALAAFGDAGAVLRAIGSGALGGGAMVMVLGQIRKRLAG